MAKTLKIVTAGPYQQKILFSRGHRSDSAKARAAKRLASSEAQKRMNLKNSRRQLALRLMATFPTAGSGWWCSFTYADEFLPKTDEEAMARVNGFRKAMRKARGKTPFLMISNIEHGERGGRVHHHGVINNTGDDFDTIRRCWRWGEVEIRPLLLDKEHNWSSLAAYMTKEPPGKLGKHGWSCTTNCPKPEIETFAVSDDTTLQAPCGTHVLSTERHSDQWSAWESIEYIWPNGAPPIRAKRKRKR